MIAFYEIDLGSNENDMKFVSELEILDDDISFDEYENVGFLLK